MWTLTAIFHGFDYVEIGEVSTGENKESEGLNA